MDGRLKLGNGPQQLPDIEETPEEQIGPSTLGSGQTHREYIPIEKGEVVSDTDQDISVLAVN